MLRALFVAAFGAATVALSGTAGGAADDIKLSTLKDKSVLKGHTAGVWQVAFSPDGATLATSSDDKTARLWDVKTGKELFVLKGHEGPVFALTFSPDGKLLASGDMKKVVYLWDVKTGKEVAALTHPGNAKWTSISADGKTAATTAEDKMLRLWDTGTGKEIKSLKTDGFGAERTAFSPDGKKLAYTEGLSVKVWNIESGETVAAQRHGNTATCVSFTPDGKTLVSGGYDANIKLWTADPLKEKLVLDKAHNGAVSWVRFSADGKTMYTLGEYVLKVWDTATGKPKQAFMVGVGSAAISPDGKTVASADGNAVKLRTVSAK